MKHLCSKFIVYVLIMLGLLTISPTALLFADNVDEGKKLYRHFCIQCHGESGKGYGVNAEFMDPPPADFTDTEDMVYFGKKNNLEIYDVIFNGGKYTVNVNPLMPTFGKTLSEYEIWTIVAYIRTLHPNNAEPIIFSGLIKKRPQVNIKNISIDEITRQEIKKGKKIFKYFGCFGCHKASKKKGGVSGGALNMISAKLNPQDIFAKIKAPLYVRSDCQMPGADISDEKALLLTKYLVSLKQII